MCLHLFLDAQRALVALATRSSETPDRDYVSYWREWSAADPEAVEQAHTVRRLAEALGGGQGPAEWWGSTAKAVPRTAPAVQGDRVVETQGHRIRVADLLATLAVEATVHHLDLLVGLEGPAPGPRSLAICRRTLDGLLGQACPCPWDDGLYLRKATGREPLAQEERVRLGRLEQAFPLFS